MPCVIEKCVNCENSRSINDTTCASCHNYTDYCIECRVWYCEIDNLVLCENCERETDCNKIVCYNCVCNCISCCC